MANETSGAAPASPSSSSETSVDAAGTTTETAGGTNPAQTQSASEAKEEAIRKFKLKFGKTEREVAEADLIALAQKGWASDEKFQEAAKERKRIAGLLTKLKDDPDQVLKHLGIDDPVGFYRQRLEAEIKKRTMDPKQREIEEAKEAIRRERMELEAEKKRIHEERLTKLQNHYQEQYDKELSEAIDKSGLPKNPRTVRRAAELAYKNIEQGLNLPWSTIMEMVREEYNEAIRELALSSDEDRIISLFGDEFIKKVQSADMKRRKIAPESKPVQQEAKGESDAPKKKQLTPDEFRERIRKFGRE